MQGQIKMVSFYSKIRSAAEGMSLGPRDYPAYPTCPTPCSLLLLHAPHERLHQLKVLKLTRACSAVGPGECSETHFHLPQWDQAELWAFPLGDGCVCTHHHFPSYVDPKGRSSPLFPGPCGMTDSSWQAPHAADLQPPCHCKPSSDHFPSLHTWPLPFLLLSMSI